MKLPVLYDQEKDTVLVNPEAFFGIFPNYSYTFDQEDRFGEIWLYNRRMAFHAGSDVTAYKISGCEGFFSMSTEAVLWKKQLWVPGGFLERWDVIFAGLLETMLLVSAGSSLFYLGLIGKLLFPKVGKKLLWGGLAVLVFLVALWCGENGKAAKIYVIWNSFVAVPVSVAFLVMVRCIGRKTERKGAVSCGKEQKSGQRKSGD